MKTKEYSRRSLFLGLARRIKQSENNLYVSGFGAVIFQADNALVDRKFEQSKKYYEQILEVEPTHREAQIGRGICFYHLEQYEKAKECFDFPLSEHILLPIYKALLALRQGERPVAIGYLRQFNHIHSVILQREVNLQIALSEIDENFDLSESIHSIEKLLDNLK